jgi:C_GCAxxG_C_C family probable redox protein
VNLMIIDIEKIREEAEAMYANNEFYCSEAIVAVIRDHFDKNMPIEAISMASGFPIGIGGSMCTCGAISGGVMCLGYFFGRTEKGDDKVKKAMALSKELYDAFIANHKVTCCSILTKDMELGSPIHMKQCVSFTGEMAVQTALMLARELNYKIKE